YAHSFEVWYKGQLVGGLYGVAIKEVFFGESMFSRISNASKIAFVYMVKYLQRWRYKLIDCQVYSDHLRSLGAEEIERSRFETIINRCASGETAARKWQPTEITGLIAI
ncbi:MAG: leucyl/phenylalanyl-tRNA--protein transferase, partial [Gammaproteobacteria bacterium]|nr:leucyl/phenylalanyl-tRNA--protein transferase [Gammaproteobacteria bacterium]